MSTPGGNMDDWQARVAAMRQRAAGVDWSKMDWSKLKASDIGVCFGKPMTEAEFAEYRKRRPVTVVRADGTGSAAAEGSGPAGTAGQGTTTKGGGTAGPAS